MGKILIAAGVGGTLPTICRLAATYSVNQNQAPPALGFYIGLALFCIIGMAVAFGFEESQLKKAFALGIAGPAIVTSVFSGASQPQLALSAGMDALPLDRVAETFGIAAAHAASPGIIRLAQPQGTPPSQLKITAALNGAVRTSIGIPVILRFARNDGKFLAQTEISPGGAMTAGVPAGAASVEVIVGGSAATASLPAPGFRSAELNLNIVVESSKSLLWALGSSENTEIKSLSASVNNITMT
jgi:hypothetical protein